MKNDFRAGAKVAFLSSNLKGSIIRVINNYEVLVALEDGFDIPAPISDLVVTQPAAGAESAEAPGVQQTVRSTEKQQVKQGIFLAFSVRQKKPLPAEVVVHLINSTEDTLLFAAYLQRDGSLQGRAGAELSPNSYIQISKFALSEADNWRQWHLQIIRFAQKTKDVLPVIQQVVKIKPQSLLENAEPLPLVSEQGLLLQLDRTAAEEAAQHRKSAKVSAEEIAMEAVGEVVDLHIEKLSENTRGLSNSSILQLQMSHFENSLHKAIAQKMERIIFIHGIGTGRLKNMIGEHLLTVAEVERYEEADPKKYGYGATAVYLKSR